MTEPPPDQSLTYEQARDELVALVSAAGERRRTAGRVAGPVGARRAAGRDLSAWLDGAKARIEAARAADPKHDA